MTKSKKEGGLGLQSARGRNTTLLTKLNWRFHTEKESLWVRVLKEKYGSNRRISSKDPNCLPCSQTWKGMKRERSCFGKVQDG